MHTSLLAFKRIVILTLFFLFSIHSFGQNRYVGHVELGNNSVNEGPLDVNGDPATNSFEGSNYYFTKSVVLRPGFEVTGADGGFSIKPLATNPPPNNSNEQNYVRVEVPSVEVATEYDLTNLDSDDKSTSYSYSDGVGRTTMTTVVEAGPNNEDIIQYHHYDATTGRQDKSYLSYIKAQSDPGQFVADSKTETETFYRTPLDATLTADNTPYSFTEFDARGRVKSVIAPGDVYHSAEKKTKYAYKMYDPATDPSKIAHWKIVNGAPKNDRYYKAKELSIVEVEDVEGRKTRTVTDMRGLTITSQVYDPSISGTNKWIGTYNVYDDFGRIRFTIPPALNGYVLNSNFSSKTISTTQIEELLFQYEYDERGRTKRTKAPGAGWVEFVYDKWDRLVLSRHQTLKLDGATAWSFVKYDALNRAIMTGLVKDNRTRIELQTLVNTKSDRFEEANNGANQYGYSINTSFPRLGSDYSSSNYELQTINYFDNYNFLNHANWDVDLQDQTDFSLVLPTGFSATELSNAIDRSTGSKVLILDTDMNRNNDVYLNTIVYYDEDGRILQTVAENHLGGIDRLTNQLDWKGEMSKMLLEHTGEEDVAILSEYKYDDHTGQLLKTFQNIADSYQTMTSSTKVEVADYNYNIMGELTEKNLHSTNGSSYLQSVDYRYNFNGSLNSINKANLNAGNDNDLFGMEYQYESAMTVGNTAIPGRYDGVATSMKWNATNVTASVNPTTGPEGDHKTALGFKYDERNRLASAHYGETTSVGSNTYNQKSDHFGMSAAYDDNGNIEELERYSKGDDIDLLDYTYEANSNKLKGVTDSAPAEGGLDDYYQGATDYAYDAMGNMTYDMNKQITGIEYNHMQYVTKITFGDGTHIDNTYDAAGNKLSKEVKDGDNNTIAKVDYVGLVEYLDDEINQVFTDEGRAYKQNGEYHYEYFIKDHQQNTRVAFGNLPERNVYTATMESDRSAYEESHFTFPSNIRTGDTEQMNHTPLGKKSVKLNATDGRALGPAKVLTIAPGDEVELEVWAKYTATGWNNSSVNNIVSLISTAFGGASAGTGGETASTSLNTALNAGDPNIYSGNDAGEPEAYLQYLFFDDAYQFVSAKSKFIKVGAASEDKFAKLSTSTPIKFNEAGYLFVYLVNESDQNKEVYFDDLSITHSSATASFKVSQVNEFYPFGLPTANSWRAPGYVDPGLLYQSSYASYDSLTGYYDFLARSYDPALGRFFAVDPAGQFNSPYMAMGNSPHFAVDPDGRFSLFSAAASLFSFGGGYALFQNVKAQNSGQNGLNAYGNSAVKSAILGASLYTGGAIAGSGIAFANTLSIIGSSAVNSGGTWLHSKGDTDFSVSFGFGSYNFSRNEWGYLGKDGNSALENIGYGLGTLANLNDVNNLIDQTKATLYTQEQYANGDKDIISHTGIVDDTTGDNLMSFGPNDNKIGGGGFKDQVGGMKPGGDYKKFGLAVRKGTPDYPVPVSLSKSTSVTANKHLFKGLRGFSKIVPYQGCTTNCVNMSSLGLWLNGIPNIGIHPYLLHYSMVAYNSGVRPDLFSYYLQRQ